MAAYGLADAPRYNLSSTTFPVSVYYGRNDYLVNFEVSIIQGRGGGDTRLHPAHSCTQEGMASLAQMKQFLTDINENRVLWNNFYCPRKALN